MRVPGGVRMQTAVTAPQLKALDFTARWQGDHPLELIDRRSPT